MWSLPDGDSHESVFLCKDVRSCLIVKMTIPMHENPSFPASGKGLSGMMDSRAFTGIHFGRIYVKYGFGWWGMQGKCFIMS